MDASVNLDLYPQERRSDRECLENVPSALEATAVVQLA
jgi:hypothetical protein